VGLASVLPARYPNLLVNGAGGIAVGMATNIPTHNLGEVIDACCAYLDDPEISVDALMEYVPGPDFPTGGIIMGKQGCRDAMHSGRGSIMIRGRAEIEEHGKDRESIVITEIPYQVNKARMIEQIANAVRAGSIEGVAELRDESDRRGMRVVVDLKRDAMGDVVLNQLYRFTSLQTSFARIQLTGLSGLWTSSSGSEGSWATGTFRLRHPFGTTRCTTVTEMCSYEHGIWRTSSDCLRTDSPARGRRGRQS